MNRTGRPNRLTRAITCLIMILGVGAGNAAGQGLSYLDASDDPFSNNQGTPANLFIPPGGSLGSLGGVVDISDNVRLEDNGLWDWTDGFGSGASIYAAGDPAQGTPGEDVPELGMRLSGALGANTDYDVYVAYWSSNDANWSIRAGFASNPGGNQVFNRTGADAFAPAAIAGIPASAGIWDALPADTVNGDAGNPFVSADRTMYLGLIGSANSGSGASIDVFVDDLPTLEGDPSEPIRDTFNRTWFEGLAFVEAGTTPFLTATIDRATGAVSIQNDTGMPRSITSYSVTSTAGGLLPNAWNSVSGGANPIDTADAWTIAQPTEPFPTAAGELGESEDGPVDGASIVDGGSFDLGNVWLRTHFEDLDIRVTLDDGAVLTVVTSYVNGEALDEGDFDRDGDIDLDDYAFLMGNLLASNPATTEAESYTLGDLNGDFTIDFDDHREFQQLFDAANGGPGALVSALAAPEPGGLALGGLTLLGLASAYRRPGRGWWEQATR